MSNLNQLEDLSNLVAESGRKMITRREFLRYIFLLSPPVIASIACSQGDDNQPSAPDIYTNGVKRGGAFSPASQPEGGLPDQANTDSDLEISNQTLSENDQISPDSLGDALLGAIVLKDPAIKDIFGQLEVVYGSGFYFHPEKGFVSAVNKFGLLDLAGKGQVVGLRIGQEAELGVLASQFPTEGGIALLENKIKDRSSRVLFSLSREGADSFNNHVVEKANMVRKKLKQVFTVSEIRETGIDQSVVEIVGGLPFRWGDQGVVLVKQGEEYFLVKESDLIGAVFETMSLRRAVFAVGKEEALRLAQGLSENKSLIQQAMSLKAHIPPLKERGVAHQIRVEGDLESFTELLTKGENFLNHAQLRDHRLELGEIADVLEAVNNSEGPAAVLLVRNSKGVFSLFIEAYIREGSRLQRAVYSLHFRSGRQISTLSDILENEINVLSYYVVASRDGEMVTPGILKLLVSKVRKWGLDSLRFLSLDEGKEFIPFEIKNIDEAVSFILRSLKSDLVFSLGTSGVGQGGKKIVSIISGEEAAVGLAEMTASKEGTSRLANILRRAGKVLGVASEILNWVILADLVIKNAAKQKARVDAGNRLAENLRQNGIEGVLCVTADAEGVVFPCQGFSQWADVPDGRYLLVVRIPQKGSLSSFGLKTRTISSLWPGLEEFVRFGGRAVVLPIEKEGGNLNIPVEGFRLESGPGENIKISVEPINK